MQPRISRRELVVAGALAGATATAARGAPTDAAPARLIELIDRLRQQHAIPALGVAAVLGGRTVLAQGFGKASLAFDVPADEQTLFHTGSVGKHFTAAAVLMLVEAGRARLEDPIGKHVRGLPWTWRSRTIHQLLTHTSGIADYEEGFAWDRPYDRASFLKMASALPPWFEPGVAWAYSNTNYMLLGFLIEDLSGQSYERFIADRLLQAAGLRHSRLDNAEAVIWNRAEPYMIADGLPSRAVQMSASVSAWPDGGLLMSASDVPAWDHSLDRGTVLSEAGRSRMWSQVTLSTGRRFPYGYGWFVEQLPHREPFLWHTGSVPGFKTFFLKAPQRGLAVMIMSNGDLGPSRAQRHIGLSLAEAISPGSTPYGLAPIPDRRPDLTRAARTMLYRGDAALDLSGFAPEMRVLIEGAAGYAAVSSLSSLGPPESFSLVQDEPRPGSRIRRYRATYGARHEHISFGYTPAGLVHAVWGI